MCKSVMEKRLQLLLDKGRYERVEAEASARMAAAQRLLDMTAEVDGVEPDWSEIKAAIEDDIDLKLRR